VNKNNIIQIHEPTINERGIEVRSLTFLGRTENIWYSSEQDISARVEKRIKAYNLVPDGAIVIPANLVALFRGWFIGGVLEDSLYRVYGVCSDRGGITGYSCSVYWVPTKEEMEAITVDMSKVHGEFHIKTKNCEEMEYDPTT